MRAESGPIGGDYAHEFLILAETGESEVFLDRDLVELTLGDRAIDYDDPAQLQGIFDQWTGSYARTDDTHDEALFHGQVPEARRVTARGIEVGHIFYFGTKYSDPLGATLTTPDGEKVAVHSGSYGIGVSRLVGAVIEASHDDKGIIWPESVTPFHAGLVNLKQGDAESDAACEALYAALGASGLDVLYDDRDERAGAKFATMELIGLPWRITVGPRGLKSGTVEVTSRRSGDTAEVPPEAAVERMRQVYQGL
jgi:prolyl-tRNA synthetase